MICGAAVRRLSVVNKKRGPSSTSGGCIWILGWRKNGAQNSLINCMMIPTALDFLLVTKESL
jgi:hypothetical protein